jgi:hypothetical protein
VGVRAAPESPALVSICTQRIERARGLPSCRRRGYLSCSSCSSSYSFLCPFHLPFAPRPLLPSHRFAARLRANTLFFFSLTGTTRTTALRLHASALPSLSPFAPFLNPCNSLVTLSSALDCPPPPPYYIYPLRPRPPSSIIRSLLLLYVSPRVLQYLRPPFPPTSTLPLMPSSLPRPPYLRFSLVVEFLLAPRRY